MLRFSNLLYQRHRIFKDIFFLRPATSYSSLDCFSTIPLSVLFSEHYHMHEILGMDANFFVLIFISISTFLTHRHHQILRPTVTTLPPHRRATCQSRRTPLLLTYRIVFHYTLFSQSCLLNMSAKLYQLPRFRRAKGDMFRYDIHLFPSTWLL